MRKGGLQRTFIKYQYISFKKLEKSVKASEMLHRILEFKLEEFHETQINSGKGVDFCLLDYKIGIRGERK